MTEAKITHWQCPRCGCLNSNLRATCHDSCGHNIIESYNAELTRLRADNAALRAEVDKARIVRGIVAQRQKDENNFAAAGQTYSVNDLWNAYAIWDVARAATEAAGAMEGR